MSKQLESLRKKIDGVDEKLHDLLMERAGLVEQIAEEKRKLKLPVINPAREASLVSRLLARHQGKFPAGGVIRIWREISGAASQMQGNTRVAVTIPEDHTGLVYQELAKDYFASVLPVQRASNALSALGMVREGEVTYAVVPWPEDGEDNPWWPYLMGDRGDNALNIAVRLPFGDQGAGEDPQEHKALVLARAPFYESGNDVSFLGLQMDEHVSRGRIADKARALGMEPLGICTYWRKEGAENLHLLEVKGYVPPQDERLARLPETLESPEGVCVSLGGYPVVENG